MQFSLTPVSAVRLPGAYRNGDTQTKRLSVSPLKNPPPPPPRRHNSDGDTKSSIYARDQTIQAVFEVVLKCWHFHLINFFMRTNKSYRLLFIESFVRSSFKGIKTWLDLTFTGKQGWVFSSSPEHLGLDLYYRVVWRHTLSPTKGRKRPRLCDI